MIVRGKLSPPLTPVSYTHLDVYKRQLSDYATRCQALIQYGHPVVDIAVFTGEEIPRRAVLPDRLVPSLPGIFGAERVESERCLLYTSRCV